MTDERQQLWHAFATSEIRPCIPDDIVNMLHCFLITHDRDYQYVRTQRCRRLDRGRLHVCPIAYVRVQPLELQLIAQRKCQKYAKFYFRCASSK
jgi:hypothetical protein